MKKTYIIPSLEVIQVKTQQMMMMSNLGSTDSTSGNLAPEFEWDDEY